MTRRAVPLSAYRLHARRYHAACICGAVRFLVTSKAQSAVACICPRCRGQGLRIIHVPSEDFTLVTGNETLTEPLDQPRQPHHFFCGTCGEACFGLHGEGQSVSVNVACLTRGDPADMVDAAELEDGI